MLFQAIMVRTYIRKTDRGSYSAEDMQHALDAVTSGELSKRKASMQYKIPRPTLIKRLKNIGVRPAPTSLGRFRRVFDAAFDSELVQHCVEMQKRYYGLSIADLRRLAFQLAERNNIAHPFSKASQMAGEEWARCFLKRNSTLSLRSPEATSLARMAGFNRVQVNKFYDLLNEERAQCTYLERQIYNVDESGITTVQKPGKIIAQKGVKQVGRAVSGEKGLTTTIVCAMSAGGSYVPPIMLFRRKLMKERLLRGAPPGTVGFPSPKGWMTNELFVKYLEHFKSHVQPSAENKILLLLDGHQSHKTLDTIEFARENHITMITLPPHTSHRLQPLDLTFFGPLKTNYNREIDRWMLNHPAQRVSDYEIGEIFGAAYLRTAVADKAITGFRAAGICPFNPNVFTDEDFSASLVTERSYDDTLPTVSDHVPTPSRSDRAPSTSGSVAAKKKPVRTRAAESHSDRAPSTSGSVAAKKKPVH